jgi:hypothetical protein
VYGLILLLLQSNCAVSKILDEETGQCRYILYSVQFIYIYVLRYGVIVFLS